MESFEPPRSSMADVRFTIVNSEKKACKHRARRLTERDWAQHKEEIIGLYSVQGLALPKVQAIFRARHNFTATDRQWKHRFKQWELDKNIKTQEMKAMVRIKQDRKINQPGHPSIIFKIRGISVDHRKIERWMNEHKIADDELYDPGPTASTPPELKYHKWQDHNSSLPSAATVLDERANSSISMPAATADAEAAVVQMEDETMLSKPRCKVVDLSWALNASIQELRDGHANDQSGYPLGTLAQNIKCYDDETTVDISNYTLAQALQQTQEEHDEISFLVPGTAQEEEWYLSLDRKQIGDHVAIITVSMEHIKEAEREKSTVSSRLELRARMTSSEYFSFRGTAIFSFCCNDPDGWDHAIHRKDVDEVARFLYSGEATVYCFKHSDPIEISAEAGNAEITQLLLSWGSPTYNKSPDFDNLIQIVWNGFIQRWGFPSHGQDVSFEDDFERCKELSSLALEYGAQIDECVDFLGHTILHDFAEATHLQTDQYLQVLQFLLGLGFDMEQRNMYGETPLLHAICLLRGNHGLISAFLASGANAKAVDKRGRGYLAIVSERLSSHLAIVPERLFSRELVLLLSADPTFSERALEPDDIGNISMLNLLDEGYWDMWSSVFEKMKWNMDAMDAFRFTRLLQPLPYSWATYQEERLQCLAKMRSRIGEAKAQELEASYELQSAQD